MLIIKVPKDNEYLFEKIFDEFKQDIDKYPNALKKRKLSISRLLLSG